MKTPSTPMTHLRKALPLVVAAAMLAACAPAGMAPAPVAPAGITVVAGDGRLAATLQAEVTPAGGPAAQRRLLATVFNHTKASINHLVVELYEHGNNRLIKAVDVPAASLDHPIRFVGLVENRLYRVQTYAYKTTGTSQKISIDEAPWFTFDMGTNDRQNLTLPIRLTDVPFSGRASNNGLNVIDGGHVTSGEEFIRFGARLTPHCQVETLGDDHTSDFRDGPLSDPSVPARFNGMNDLVVVGDVIYVADTYNNRIRKIEDGIVSTLFGDGTARTALGPAATLDGPLASARTDHPVSIAADPDGNLYVLEQGTPMAPGTVDVQDLDGDGNTTEPAEVAWQVVRKIATDGTVTTIAGGWRDGSQPGSFAGRDLHFADPTDIAVDPSGTKLYVADFFNSVVEEIALDDVNYTGRVVAGQQNVNTGANDPVGTQASLHYPGRVEVDLNGDVLVLDANGGAGGEIRKIATTGTYPVTTLVGDRLVAADAFEVAQVDGRNGTFRGVGGIAVDAFGGILAFDIERDLDDPEDPAVDLIEAEEFNLLRRVGFDNTGAPVIETLAGDPANWAVDGQGWDPAFGYQGPDAAFGSGIGGMAFDADGHLYYIDKYANCIRRIKLLPPEGPA